jgi:hypothetical protein
MDPTYEQNDLILVGGKFVNQGEDSCIYLDGPVGCVPGTLVIADPSYNKNDLSLVSRIIPRTEDEFANQIEVRKAIDRLDLKYPGLRFREHFNVAVATCTPLMRNEDLKSDLRPNYCTASNLKDKDLRTVGPKYRYTNFLTSRQGPNLRNSFKEPKVYFRKAFFELMNTTVALNSEEILHYDLHSGNIAWTMDPFPKKTLVLFDWGRCVLNYNDFLKVLIRDEKFFKSKENLSQYNFQKVILQEIIGAQSYKQYIALHPTKGQSLLSPLEKLFYSWDTFSLLHFLTTKNIPGMEDFAAEAKFTTDVLGKNAGETGRLLLKNAILGIKFKVLNGKIIFRDHLWGIIATLFKQKPVYQQGNLYVSTYTTGGPKKDIIDNTVYTEFAPGALEDSEGLDLDLDLDVEEGTRPYSGSLSRSRSRSIIDLVSRSPQSIIDLVSKSPSPKKKKSPSPKKKKKKSPSPKKKKSPSPKKKKSPSPKKKKSCSPGKVRDTRTKRCRERRKPGPQPKSGCPKGKVRDKYSKRCRSSRR